MRLLSIFTLLFATLAIAAPANENTENTVDSTNNMDAEPRCRPEYRECIWVSGVASFKSRRFAIYGHIPLHFWG